MPHMRSTACRVTVIGPRRRLDLAVPGSVPVAELLPELVRLGGGEPAEDLRRWSLTTLAGAELPAGRSLDDCGVLDGAVLVLRHPALSPVGLLGTDVVETVTTVTDAAGGRWGPGPARILRLAALGAAAAAVAVVAAVTLDGAGAAALAVALSAAAAIAGTRDSGAAAVLALAAAPAYAVAAVELTDPATPAGIVTAAAVGAVVAGLVALLAAPRSRPAAVALMLTGTALGAAAAATTRADGVDVAAVTTLLAVAAIPAFPAVALRLGGLGPTGDRRTPEGQAAAAQRARTQLPWLLAGDAVLLVAAVPLLVFSESVFAQVLAPLAGVVTVLRARDFAFVAEVVPLAVAGVAALAVTDAMLVAAALRAGSTGLAIALVVVPVLLLLVPVFVADQVDLATLARFLRRLDTVLLLGLVPLVVGVLGGYDAVGDAAGRLV